MENEFFTDHEQSLEEGGTPRRGPVSGKLITAIKASRKKETGRAKELSRQISDINKEMRAASFKKLSNHSKKQLQRKLRELTDEYHNLKTN